MKKKQKIVIKDVFLELEKQSERRLRNFKVVRLDDINDIRTQAYLEKPIWLGGQEEFVCLFIDLDDSSKLSYILSSEKMAKIYDYFTQNIIDILNIKYFRADYLDIKGDGVLAVFQGDNAVPKAVCAAVTFKTFFDRYIRPKFQTKKMTLNCKLAVDKDKILVRKMGRRGYSNQNEVWAGKVINNTFKLSSLTKKIYIYNKKTTDNRERSLLVISNKVYSELKEKGDAVMMRCPHKKDKRNKSLYIWKKHGTQTEESVFGDYVWYTAAMWCEKCSSAYIAGIMRNS